MCFKSKPDAPPTLQDGAKAAALPPAELKAVHWLRFYDSRVPVNVDSTGFQEFVIFDNV